MNVPSSPDGRPFFDKGDRRRSSWPQRVSWPALYTSLRELETMRFDEIAIIRRRRRSVARGPKALAKGYEGHDVPERAPSRDGDLQGWS